ncbi:MAG: dTMP kinase [Actinomycetota bacterium]|nr:dTMP kinase [Actinomycetota bacterium]
MSVADEVAALRGTKPATLKDLFRHPSFSKLMAAMTVSSLGDWVGFVAVTSLVARLEKHSPSAAAYAVAGVMMARILPSVLFGPLAGVIVDRVNRKHLMIAADIGRGLMYASMPLLGRLWAILLLSFCIECLSLVWTPAKDSSVPNLVPRRQLVNANTLGLATTYGTLPLGGIVFAVLVGVSVAIGHSVPYFQHTPESLALWLDAGTFGFSAYMVNQLPIRRTATQGAPFQLSRAGKDIKDGIRFLRRHSLVRAMTVGIVVAFAGVGSVIALGPVFARLTLHAGSSGWGFLVTSIGIGMGLGMASLGQVSKFIEREHLFPIAMISGAVALFVDAAMPNILLASLVTVFLGFFAGMTWVTGYALLQENVADEFRGRTFATLTVMSRLGMFGSFVVFPLIAGAVGDHGTSVGGVRLDLAGTRIALWAGGVVVLLAGASSLRGLRRHRLTKPQPLALLPRLVKGPRPGVFVVFEGVEGAGKGTQIELARQLLEREGIRVLVTREPGGTELGERLRELLLDPKTGTVEPRTEALLFAASRSQHVAAVIRPALEEGKVVLCDRFIDSSLAYQGVARGLGEQDVLTLNVWATQGLFPDLVILLHLEPEEGLARAGQDGDADRIESEGPPFHAKVADAFLKIAEEHPERIVVVDAGRPPEVVHEQVREALMRVVRGPQAETPKP